VAEIFHAHTATVRRWLINKTLHGKKIGKKWLVPVEEVERLREAIKRVGSQ
jgi:excisionase family DNA binding protein